MSAVCPGSGVLTTRAASFTSSHPRAKPTKHTSIVGLTRPLDPLCRSVAEAALQRCRQALHQPRRRPLRERHRLYDQARKRQFARTSTDFRRASFVQATLDNLSRTFGNVRAQ